jgi:hypothetical protein
MESGAFDLIVDDNAPDMPEAYHDQVARMVADFLSRNPHIEDAGLRHVVWGEEHISPEALQRARPVSGEERGEIAD